jgi:hypothetical protein
MVDCFFEAQGVARGKVSVRDGADLSYPSLIISLADKLGADQPNVISLSSCKRISTIGMLLSSDEFDVSHSGRIYVDSLAVVEGVLYSSGYTDLRGHIYGSVITRHFHYFRRPTTYINWLRDAVIDRSRLMFRPSLPLAFEINGDFGIHRLEYYQ